MLLHLQDYGTSVWQLTCSSYQLVRPFDRVSWQAHLGRQAGPPWRLLSGVDLPRRPCCSGAVRDPIRTRGWSCAEREDRAVQVTPV
jgi:hypothetical protein